MSANRDGLSFASDIVAIFFNTVATYFSAINVTERINYRGSNDKLKANADGDLYLFLLQIKYDKSIVGSSARRTVNEITRSEM